MDGDILIQAMHTAGLLYLSDNFTRHEVYQTHKDDMLLQVFLYNVDILIDYGSYNLTVLLYSARFGWVFSQ